MSAGGVAPLKTLFQKISDSTGMAFVVIHHVRTFRSHLPQLLSGWTRMPVKLVSHGLLLRPDHVYVLPSGLEIALRDGNFVLRRRTKRKGWANVISVFLESLSKGGHPGIAVILSGMDQDGAVALAASTQKGGLTIVQDPETARSPAMPEAATKTGYVKYVLPPEEIPERLEKTAVQMRMASEQATSLRTTAGH
jgi:chemotaxis response regulator CheB